AVIIEQSLKKLTEMLIYKTENEIQKLEDGTEQSENDRLYNMLKKHFRKNPKSYYKRPFFSDSEGNSHEESELVRQRRSNLLKRAFAENFIINHTNFTFYNSTDNRSVEQTETQSVESTEHVPKSDETVLNFIESAEHKNFLINSSEKLFFLICSLLGWNIPRLKDDELRLADVFYSCCSLNETSGIRNSVYHNCETLNTMNTREKEVRFGPTVFVTYSLCGNKKIGTFLKETFMSHITKEFSYNPNYIIHIADHNDEFFLSLDLFLSLFFFILNYNNHPDRNLQICQIYHKTIDKNSMFTYLKFKNYLKKKLGKDTKIYKKDILPNDEDIKILAKYFKPDRNEVVFKVSGIDHSSFTQLFNWSINDKIVISDIDGTITKSDVLGHIYDFMGKDWSHCGVAELFTKIQNQNYKFLYLSNRPVGMYDRTSKMIQNIQQNGYKMPDGPIILNPTGIFNSLVLEVRNVSYHYKIEALKQIRDCFVCNSPAEHFAEYTGNHSKNNQIIKNFTFMKNSTHEKNDQIIKNSTHEKNDQI
ncbi:Protein involved in plasmid maintenance/nuclear protein involved in lipid metabolism, partial [Pseudoloma neurophilia]